MPHALTGSRSKTASPDSDLNLDSPRSFVSALSDLERASISSSDAGPRSPRTSAEESRTSAGGRQRLQLSPIATALLREARAAIAGESLHRPGPTCDVPCQAMHLRISTAFFMCMGHVSIVT